MTGLDPFHLSTAPSLMSLPPSHQGPTGTDPVSASSCKMLRARRVLRKLDFQDLPAGAPGSEAWCLRFTTCEAKEGLQLILSAGRTYHVAHSFRCSQFLFSALTGPGTFFEGPAGLQESSLMDISQHHNPANKQYEQLGAHHGISACCLQ